ncbi:hypothetical protein ACJ5NV_12940 [Loktanella agnita]|uniref:hypothetical protein n=1 Tax=Loktanella agnita TaxID=287097 RepID=UPI003986D13E
MFNFAPAIPARSDLDWCWYLRRQGRAGEVLERVLHDLGVMDPSGWSDWSPSALTDTGSPIEMWFSAGQSGLQLMTAIGDPARGHAHQVDQVCRVMAERGGKTPDAALRDVIAAAQGSTSLSYGAWLGLRVIGARVETKLYAELPEGADDLSALMSPTDVAPVMETLGDTAHATMIGYDGHTGQTTIYGETDQTIATALPMLAALAHVPVDMLALAVERLVGDPSVSDLPPPRLGFSFAMQEAGKPPELTLLFAANTLFKNDEQAGQRIKACGGEALDGYGALIDNLPHAPCCQLHHGRIGLTARQEGAPVLSVGVAAPWHPAADSI